MGSELLEIKNLVKKYDSKIILDNLSFNVNQGEILGILGPNGAGKSTSFNIISGLMNPDSGNVYFEKEEINLDIKKYKMNIGVVPQDISLYDNLSVIENLHFFGKMYGVVGQELKNRVNTILDKIQLQDKRNVEIKKLSGGMKRRINIAAALIHEPQLIIMDEPTVGIDPQSRSLVWDIIEDLKEDGKSIILTTHYVDEIERLSDRVLIIDLGKVIVEGTIDELINNYCQSNTYILEFYKMNELLVDKFKKLANVDTVITEENIVKIITIDGTNIMGNILQLLIQNDASIKEIEYKKQNLEDVFFHFTGRGLRE